VALTVGFFRRIEHVIGEAFAWTAAMIICGGLWMLNWLIDPKSDRRSAAKLLRAARREGAARRWRQRRAVWDRHFGGHT
jgi:hypothetical protein